MTARNGRFSLNRRKKRNDGDLDITPMIDVVFLLLIFFMVTSTMQATPDRDIPPAFSGDNANMGNFTDLTILAPATPGSDSQIVLDGNKRTLDELQQDIEGLIRTNGSVKLMFFAERDVRNGFVAEVESTINAIEGDIEYKFAVLDR